MVVPTAIVMLSILRVRLDAVRKDMTAHIQVTVSPNPSPEGVTLHLRTRTGTDSALFAANNSSNLYITTSTDVEIKGISQSSTANNIRLEALVEGVGVNARDFTVLFVTFAFRNSQSQTVSSTNSGANDYLLKVGTLGLVTRLSRGTLNNYWGTGVELVGAVSPTNYTGIVTLRRTMDAKCTYNNHSHSTM